jgi:hypothetical protein
VVSLANLSVGATGRLPAPASGAGITLNNASLTQVSGGVIASQSVVMNGSSTLTLAGANSLTTLTFNNNGGSGPNLATTGGVLTLTGDITAFSSNPASISAITAGNIEIGSGARTITVHPVTFDATSGGTIISPYAAGLNVTAILQTAVNTGSLVKAGAGNLQLSGVNTFGVAGSTGVDLQAGGLILNVATALGAGNLLVSQPGTSLSSSVPIRSIFPDRSLGALPPASPAR